MKYTKALIKRLTLAQTQKVKLTSRDINQIISTISMKDEFTDRVVYICHAINTILNHRLNHETCYTILDNIGVTKRHLKSHDLMFDDSSILKMIIPIDEKLKDYHLHGRKFDNERIKIRTKLLNGLKK